MAKKLITFLGKGRYECVIYKYQDKTYPTRFFTEAVSYFMELHPPEDKVLLFVTKEVEEHNNYATLSKRMKENLGIEVKPVPIPEARQEKELWAIFDQFIEEVQEGDTIIFDITNSFRSLPFLVFIAAAYLRAARNVHIERILYGAYEARNGDIAPVFDLTPFLDLLDWLRAAHLFVHTGAADEIAGLLEEKASLSDQPEEKASLSELAQTARQISDGLFLLRPFEVAGAASKLKDLLPKGKEGTSEEELSSFPKPFEILAPMLAKEYQQFACTSESIEECLRQQLAMICWYYRKGHLAQAVALSREWAVSWGCWKCGCKDWRTYEGREQNKEGELSPKSLYLDSKKAPHCEDDPSSKLLSQLRRLWKRKRGTVDLANARNDVLHAGFNTEPRNVDQVKKDVREIVLELLDIAEKSGLALPSNCDELRKELPGEDKSSH